MKTTNSVIYFDFFSYIFISSPQLPHTFLTNNTTTLSYYLHISQHHSPDIFFFLTLCISFFHRYMVQVTAIFILLANQYHHSIPHPTLPRSSLPPPPFSPILFFSFHFSFPPCRPPPPTASHKLQTPSFITIIPSPPLI